MFKPTVKADNIMAATTGADQRLDELIRLQTQAIGLLQSILAHVSKPQSDLNLREKKGK